MEYLKLFKSLSDAGVKYLLCGGVAVNIYGIPRMTADIDFIIELTEGNVSKFEKAMRELGYSTALPINLAKLCDTKERHKLIEQKNLKAVQFISESSKFFSIDVIIDFDDFESFWENRNKRIADDTEINLVSLDDLITMKLKANRPQDISDIENLKRITK